MAKIKWEDITDGLSRAGVCGPGKDKEAGCMKYRKKPIIVDAVQWIGHSQSTDEVKKLGGTRAVVPSPVLEPTKDNPTGEYLQIVTLEGVMTAIVGDYIIKGVNGEIYPRKPDIFEKTYEAVEQAWKELESPAERVVFRKTPKRSLVCLQAKNPDDLEHSVASHIAEGWELHGDLHISEVLGKPIEGHFKCKPGEFYRIYTQAVVRVLQ